MTDETKTDRSSIEHRTGKAMLRVILDKLEGEEPTMDEVLTDDLILGIVRLKSSREGSDALLKIVETIVGVSVGPADPTDSVTLTCPCCEHTGQWRRGEAARGLCAGCGSALIIDEYGKARVMTDDDWDDLDPEERARIQQIRAQTRAENQSPTGG